MKRRIAILAGNISFNIGNAFFQMGAEHVVKQVFPNDDVFMIGDLQGYAYPKQGSPENALEVVDFLDIDYLVVLGPFVRPEFHTVLLPTLKKLAAKGTRFLMMGVGMMQYDDATISGVKEHLKTLPIDAFITRDRPTFEAFHEVARHSWDGVDVAFFVSDVWQPRITPNMNPYVVLNFDQIPEPAFVESSAPNAIPIGTGGYELIFSGWRRKFSERGPLYNILERMMLPAGTVKTLGGLDVIRTDHRYNPIIPKKVYNAPKTYSGDIPHSYFAIYAGTQLTLSNRVHACAATLSFGNPAMLVSKTPRAYLLDRAGAQGIKERPTRLDMDALAKEKADLVAFLANAVATKAS